MNTIMMALFSLTATVLAYDGSATFYGAGGAGEQGACGLSRGFNGVSNTVAIAPDQYEGGRSCGRCVRVYSGGEGNGVKKPPRSLFATVDNLCPECRSGDIDLGLDGDGIWRVNWEFVPCQRRLRG